MNARRRGSVLIVVMLIVSAMAGMALVIARSARVEAMTSSNQVAGAKASAIERAAEQYVIALIASQRETILTLDESTFEAVPVGDAGAFWIVRPDYGDSSLPVYGVVDEASKLNLNTATRDMLRGLPSMPQELPDSIFDWRDEDENLEGEGAESQYYENNFGYQAKNANFESVEELLLVQGADAEILFGNGAPGGMLAANTGSGYASGGMRGGTMGEGDMLARGLLPYLTVYSRAPNPNGSTNARVGRINVNTAPREVLLCLPGMTDADANSLISRRSGTGFGQTDTAWFNEVLGPRAAAMGNLITGTAYQFSADIVAASSDGRSFRRARIVVDAYDTANPPKIVYRHDLTDRGWPLDPQLLASMRDGTWARQNSPRRG